MQDNLAYFLDLRLRLRGRPEAIALVDRCIQLIARAEKASPGEVASLDREAEQLREDLTARFGTQVSPSDQLTARRQGAAISAVPRRSPAAIPPW